LNQLLDPDLFQLTFNILNWDIVKGGLAFTLAWASRCCRDEDSAAFGVGSMFPGFALNVDLDDSIQGVARFYAGSSGVLRGP